MSQALKLFGQLIIIGGQIVGKVISGAYKQALASMRCIPCDNVSHFMSINCVSVVSFLDVDAAKNPNIAKNGGGKGGSTMTVDEAVKILNCQQNPSREDVLQVATRMRKL